MTSFTFRPISSWPGAPTRNRARSPFSATYTRTLRDLRRELDALGAKRVVIELDLTERQIRIDGLPKATARPASPGVIVSFDSEHGPLRYACDWFLAWEDNLRAIALGLESLRRVERYGIASRGEQYSGWKALPASTLTPAAARQRLAEVVLAAGAQVPATDRGVARMALTLSHPDNGGDPDRFRDEILPAYQLLTGERA